MSEFPHARPSDAAGVAPSLAISMKAWPTLVPR
jgi:hypothetical protein